jgi:hypothetical protein
MIPLIRDFSDRMEKIMSLEKKGDGRSLVAIITNNRLCPKEPILNLIVKPPNGL